MIINFVPGSKDIEDLVDSPQPGKFFIPEWYKEILGGKDIVNVKKCIPFLDSISNGYIQSTWTDITVKHNENGLNVFYDHKVKILDYREKTDMPIKNEFYNIEFVWQRPWSVILPDNISALVVHPLNRIDLPFTTLSGIVDFDKSLHAPIGNIPFFIKKDFVGTIPKGTPMFQIIPFERYEWISEKQQYNENLWIKKTKERQGIVDFYKKKVWHRKSFD